MLYWTCIFIFNACIFNYLANIKRDRLIDRLTERGRKQQGTNSEAIGDSSAHFPHECLPWRTQEAWQWLLLLFSPMGFALCVSSAFRNSYFFTQLGTSRQAHTFVWCSTEATAIDFRTRRNTVLDFLKDIMSFCHHSHCWKNFQGYVWLSSSHDFF